MFNISLKYRFLEHGMFYKKGGGVSDIQTLVSTKGLPGSQALLDALNFPEDSLFKNNFGAVSFAFISTDWGWAFVQLQRRLEYESNNYVMKKKSGGLFNQTRFTLIDTADIIKLFSQGFCVFNGLIVNFDNDYSLKKYDRAIDEFVELHNLEFSLPAQDYLRLIKKPLIANAIKAIGRAIQNNDQVVIIMNENEFSLFERLVIVQEVERIILPLFGIPVSFALDYIVHPLSTIGVRFQNNNEVNGSKAQKINLDAQSFDDYIDRVFEFLYADTSSWQEEDKLKWQSCHELLYKDGVAIEFARQKRPLDTAKWLKNILLSGSDILNYYRTLFEYGGEIENELYMGYFNSRYENLKENKSVFELFLLDKALADNFLLSISEGGFLEVDFSLIDWAQIVVFSNAGMEQKKKLLKSHKDTLTLDDAKHLLRWVRNKKDKILFKSENIIYELFKEKLYKDTLSAEFVLAHLTNLVQTNPENEVGYWCQFLSVPKNSHSIWGWTSSIFRELKDNIFVALLEKENKSKPLIGKWLDTEDKKKIKSLKGKNVFNRSILIQSLYEFVEKENSATSTEKQRVQVDVVQETNKANVRHVESVEYEKMSFDDGKGRVSRHAEKVSVAMLRVDNKKRNIVRVLFAIATVLIVSFIGRFGYIQAFNLNIFDTPTKEVVTSLPSTEIIASAVPTQIDQNLPLVLWRDLGFLYFTQLKDDNDNGVLDETETQNLYMIDASGQKFGPVQADFINDVFIKDVFVNNDGLLFYTSNKKNERGELVTSINFSSQAYGLSELVSPKLNFEKPSVYPGSNQLFDAAFVCQGVDLCLLYRRYDDPDNNITRYDLNLPNEVYDINPWYSPNLYPSPKISALSWLDTNNLLFTFAHPNKPNLIYIFNLTNQDFLPWSSTLPETIVDIRRWSGSTLEKPLLAVLAKEQSGFAIYSFEVENNAMPEKKEIKKYALPLGINDVYQLEWDPQKNQIAFIGTLANSQDCKIGCVFLLDILTDNVKRVDLGDGIRSIYWTTTR